MNKSDKQVDNVAMFENACKQMSNLYYKKNEDYGDSFSKSFKEYGLTMSCIRLEDKLNRLKAFNKNGGKIEVKSESIRDTLIDLANYAVMTIIEIDKMEKVEEKKNENN